MNRKRSGIADYANTDFSKLIEKSRIIRHDRWPAWEQTFCFSIEPPPIDDDEIDIIDD
eukprot:CAMPEP_0197319222 /NCGR_PEP_ID=MMETSP0891-20130614/53913_1 /TAXON_ID=44058 ORGANISM="Aureoumbra lagunensis, Strain CCMP1510" /NCGR_SAMPLE_ID=MMETSP0891 /ASSEMBLY_ACC=CAM_ASM_000534 /LENGTH=57 /DNA_ID=CAMNT_0042810043 /DNA_START=408 /DNA_END=578 /DNA_ORIENTATION=+